jgi:hypothetical protein
MTGHRYEPLSTADKDASSGSMLELGRIGNNSSSSLQKNSCNEIFLNTDVLYRFNPKAGFRNLKCLSTKSASSAVQCVITEPSFVLLNLKADGWYYLICDRLEGWIQIDDSHFSQNGPLQRVDKFYMYEDWKGKACFFFKGRVMFGPDLLQFLGANIAYIVVFVFYMLGIIPLILELKIILEV